MSMLHVHRSTQPKLNTTSDQICEQVMFNKNVVHCLYNLLQKFGHYKTLTPEMVHEQLEMVFDINVIEDQFEKLAESVLGQCVQQVHVETDSNTLRSVSCKYIYGSKVAANRVKPGTSVPTVGYHTLENKMKMHDILQIQSKVTKKLINYLSGIHEELLKAGDISSVKNTNASKQNTLANYYEHLEYQNELKNKSMHAGLCYRLIEEMFDRSPPLYSLPPTIKDYSRQSQSDLLSWLLGATSKYTFALNKFGNRAKENSILAEIANVWRINTDNSLSPVNCESNIIVEGENVPISGVVVLTENCRERLQHHIIARKTILRNNVIVCDVNPEDFNPQKAFITDGKIKMETTNLFVKEEKEAVADNYEKRVEFLKLGSEMFAVHVLDPVYYQGDTYAQNRFRETVKVDFMMPLSIKFEGSTNDDLFKKDNESNPHVIPTVVYFKDAKGVTRNIRSNSMVPFVTGMLSNLVDFKSSVVSASQRLSKMFKIPQITKGREKDFLKDQLKRCVRNLYDSFPMHYSLPIGQTASTLDVEQNLEMVFQKPLWVMISGLKYEAIITNILALWNDQSYTNSLSDENALARHSLATHKHSEQVAHLINHMEHYVKRNNPSLFPWIAEHGRKIKQLLVEKLKYPENIIDHVDFVLYMLNSEQLYRQVLSKGNYHLGLGFVLNRTEVFETESMLLSRCQGYKLFYSQTSTEVRNDCQSPNFNLITSMQTGHMPSSLSHPCIRYPHCILSEHGTMGGELFDADLIYRSKSPQNYYDEQKWIPIFTPCQLNESMFEDTFNPFGRSNIPFEKDTLEYLNPDECPDPLSGISGFNPMSLGMINVNFVCYSKLLSAPFGFSLKKHIVPNSYINFWFNEFQKNANRCTNRVMMTNLQDNLIDQGELKLHYDDLSLVVGGSTSKFCYSHPKLAKTLMSERDNRTLPGRHVFRLNNDFILPGSKLMENLDRGVNVNDRYLLNL